ncbi:DUF308 domain-containing protein [Candidatus Saccharibacteria bacterium]|nr:DUF308 domain-containing protein [Candidatus Saccharibacteria bacterium]
MKDRIKKFINSAIITSVAFIVLGIVFICFPEGSLDLIRWIVAIFFFTAGAYMIAANAGSKRPMFGASMLGVIMIIGGLIFAFNERVMNILPIVLGAWFIISSLSTISYSTALQNSNAKAFSIITSVLAIVCGILLIINPWGGQIAMMTFAGIMMLIYSISSLIDLLTLKKNLQDINKKFNKFIEEGEIVEENKK